ncbi:MAG: guanylate kinase [Flavobacteriaceae bacterium]|nr:guanylate kinase [Flavobacteriaceae bacterium]
MKKGKLIIFSAPSGSGKTTIVHHLLKQKKLQLEFSISVTSRKKRGQEIDGKDYYFISIKKFNKLIKEDKLIEFEEVYRDHFYGTLKKEVKRIRKQGKNVIFDIDVIGGLNIKKQFSKKTLTIFVKPPSIEEMERRLRNRNTDTEKKIKERVIKAKKEFNYAKEFDVTLVNDDLEKAKKEAFNLVNKFVNK